MLFIIFMYLVVPLKSIVLLLAWNQGFVDELTFCILFVSYHYLWATKNNIDYLFRQSHWQNHNADKKEIQSSSDIGGHHDVHFSDMYNFPLFDE